jgi:hypothetical protein
VLKRINMTVVVLALFFSMGVTVYAETGGAGNGTGTGGVGTTNIPGGMTGYRTTATDRDTDWGWVGLLGLAGLAGLMGRNRNENPDRR